jgi:LysM repeat protein
MSRLTRFFHLICIIFLLVCFSKPLYGVNAQSVSASDVINAVNALRTSRGLDPFRVDSGLMSYAQQHADYMASIQSATHTHSDGSTAWESGIQENVASGTDGLITAEIVVNQIWSDYIHLRVMVEFTSGDVGAGVALGADGNEYFVLNVIGGDTTVNTNQISATEVVLPTVAAVATTPVEWIVPLTTSTPNAEGEVIHVVQNGQTLWNIADAYDVSIEDIRLLNNIAMDSTVINIGQELLIMRVTVQPTVAEEVITPSPIEVTERPSATATSGMTETEVISAFVIETATPEIVNEEQVKTQNFNFIYVLVTVILIGLLFFSYFGFIRTEESSSEDLSNEK